LEPGAGNAFLYVVRAGAVELRSEGGELLARLDEGACFGDPSLLTGQPTRVRATALEDTLLYLLPASAFHELRRRSPPFDRFFEGAHALRVRGALRRHEGDAPVTTPLRNLLTRPPVCAPPQVSVREAARVMTEARVSSLLITEGERLLGILTDRDLRTRVVAAGLSPETPVAQVMTRDVKTIQVDAYAFEALLEMTRHTIHHLPVVDEGGALLGMVTTTDLMRLQSASPAHLVGDVRKQADVAGLERVSRRVPEMFLRLMDAGARAEDVGRVLTLVADAVSVRLLELAEAEFGLPPVPYAWLALGSGARGEMSPHSDQDNALVLADEAGPEHEGYFGSLATFVSDGLAACGYAYCPGEVMATTPRWRQPLRVWRGYFADWTARPEPEALLNVSVFFDLRHVHGDAALTGALHGAVLAGSRNGIFLAHLAANALTHRPPLGFFRRFVLERGGEHARTLDLKHKGVAPVVDLARVYALSVGSPETGTYARLRGAAAEGGLSAEGGANLQGALEFVARVRFRHQAAQLRRGETPDNHVSPESLSPFERRHLRDAFEVVATMQAALAERFQVARIR